MILEVAVLNVELGKQPEFEAAFSSAQEIISSMKGYLSHQLQKCIEKEDQYVLLVNWECLEDHTEGFRGSPQYQQWRAALQHFYASLPDVNHYEVVFAGPKQTVASKAG
jgi:heme-degrading monooxygenase HmoA